MLVENFDKVECEINNALREDLDVKLMDEDLLDVVIYHVVGLNAISGEQENNSLGYGVL